MLDIRRIREDPDPFRAALARRNLSDAVDRLLDADERRRSLTARVEELRAEQNRASKAIGAAQGDEKQKLIDEVAKVSAELKDLEPQLADAEEDLNRLLAEIPNVPHESAPDGFTEEDAVEVRRNHDEPPAFDFEPRDHAELGAILGVLDTERGARTSGSRFVYLMGDLVFVQFALMRHAMDIVVEEGFAPMIPPVLVREEAMYGTGWFPTEASNVYGLAGDDLYLVGTAEVPLGGMHGGEIFELDALPIRYAGFSTCFRREAGAAGKDTRGMFRVHQFDKVEMFVFCPPERSSAEHDHLLSVEEELVQELGVPYRVVNVAAGDLGAAAVKKYDIEAWFPSQGRYREITSTSNTTDYQARRLGIRYRGEQGLETVHTLNGTAVTARVLLAIMENRQEEDGSWSVPEVLEQFGAPGSVSRAN